MPKKLKKIVKNKKNKAKSRKQKVVAVSGGFDPVHIGHVRMFNEAKALGDRLIVIMNNDNWLAKKKGFVFMPENERKEIIESFGSVDEVFITKHPENPEDMSVCEALRSVKPHIFANGGDRFAHNIPEVPVCEEINCQMVFNVGAGGKVQSSSWLASNVIKEMPCPCGAIDPTTNGVYKYKQCGLINAPHHQKI
jgi:D-beta-D-heptose 7-phosphate kinase/D-beta-D-heptose 1-phosphate adenosyltransferase